MPPVGYELKISTGERPKTYALDHAATGTGGVQLKTKFLFAPLPPFQPYAVGKLESLYSQFLCDQSLYIFMEHVHLD